MKKETHRHPKTYALADKLSVSRATALGHLTLLWDFVEDHAIQGDVGKWPDGAIARASDWSGDATAFVSALVEVGWLDEHPEHRLVVHDWCDHCQSWVRAKLQRAGLGFIETPIDATIEGSQDESIDEHLEPSSCAPTEPNQTKPSRTKPNQTRSSAPDRNYSADFLRFWEIFPAVRKGSKPVAWKAWCGAVFRATPEEIITAATEFAESDLAKTEFCPGPAPWLNQDRWDDDRRSWQRRDGPNGVHPTKPTTRKAPAL